MISLLDLQLREIDTKENARQAYLESIHRFKSISAVHDILYQSNVFSNLLFHEYIMKITGELVNAYNFNGNITFDYDLEDVSLDLQTAIPMGLIINEIITNSLKHAFKNRKNGRIKISCHCVEKKLCELTVADNGIGLPKDFDLAKIESLGFNLISMLTKQVEGELSVKSENGTAFNIRFPINL